MRLFRRNNFGLFIHLALKGWLGLSEHKRELKDVGKDCHEAVSASRNERRGVRPPKRAASAGAGGPRSNSLLSLASRVSLTKNLMKINREALLF